MPILTDSEIQTLIAEPKTIPRRLCQQVKLPRRLSPERLENAKSLGLKSADWE